jgi:hypothetical protein
VRTFCPLCISLPASVMELEEDQHRGLRVSIRRAGRETLKRIIPHLYENATASLRNFYGTFTTTLPPSGILHSVKADDALSSEL